MFPVSWFTQRFTTGWARSRRGLRSTGRQRRVPLQLENLEDRLTPTTTINVPASTLGLILAIDLADHVQGPVTLNLPAKTVYVLEAPVSTSLPPGDLLNPLSFSENYDWYGPNGLPAIDNNITINGHGSAILRDPFAPDFRLFYVSSGSSGLPLGELTLNDTTLLFGIAKGGDGFKGGGGGLGAGGAIFNQGLLNLNRVTLAFNHALGGNGGSNPNGDVYGGGGGGMGANADGNGNGGGFGVFPSGVYGGLGGSGAFEHGGGGGGFLPGDNGSAPNAGGQGGLGGSATGGDGGDGGSGAAADHYNLDAVGGNFGFGGTFVSTDGGGGGGVGGGGAGGGQNPDTSGDGGLALYAGNGGFGGGGGSHYGTGGFGGGNGGDVTSGGDGGQGLGGAIFNMSVGFYPSGAVTMTDCTLTSNSAQGGNGGDGDLPGSGGSGFGGALYDLNGFCMLKDDTVDANLVSGGDGGADTNGSIFSAGGSAGGGAVYNLAFGNNIVNGGATTASLQLFNSILADSTGGLDLVSSAIGGNAANTADVIGSTNLVESYNLGFQFDTSFITQHASPGLGPLQDNGGQTPTMAILSKSSDAFGKGNPLFALDVATDARGPGFARVVSGRLDLGAYEVQAGELSRLQPIRPPYDPGHLASPGRLLPGALGEGEDHGRHLPGRSEFDEVSLDRGIVHEGALFSWLESIQHSTVHVQSFDTVAESPGEVLGHCADDHSGTGTLDHRMAILDDVLAHLESTPAGLPLAVVAGAANGKRR